jgi:hypothetical protein
MESIVSQQDEAVSCSKRGAPSVLPSGAKDSEAREVEGFEKRPRPDTDTYHCACGHDWPTPQRPGMTLMDETAAASRGQARCA